MADEKFPLRLTEPQRTSMIHGTRIKGGIKDRMLLLDKGPQVFLFTRKELEHLREELPQAALFASEADRKRLIAVLRSVEKLLTAMDQDLSTLVPRSTGQPTADLNVFQFKITLLDTEPEIWRRIQIPNVTLEALHVYIQVLFDWEDCHLHGFEIDGLRYGPSDGEEGLQDDLDEATFTIRDLIPNPRARPVWHYVYDFGDDWRHEIAFEGHPPADPQATSPRCLEGERAGPFEDCGGPYGYSDILEAFADPRHEEHEYARSRFGKFGPAHFDVKRATKALQKVKLYPPEEKPPWSPFVGRWHVHSHTGWMQDEVDSVFRSQLQFHEQYCSGSFGPLSVYMSCQYGTRDDQPLVSWTWGGGRVGSSVTGRGEATLQGEELHAVFQLESGEEFKIIAGRKQKRKPRQKAAKKGRKKARKKARKKSR